ncbi:MAG: hypothetical protein ACRDV4_11575 [Acidimicrobiales bacterium]
MPLRRQWAAVGGISVLVLTTVICALAQALSNPALALTGARGAGQTVQVSPLERGQSPGRSPGTGVPTASPSSTAVVTGDAPDASADGQAASADGPQAPPTVAIPSGSSTSPGAPTQVVVGTAQVSSTGQSLAVTPQIVFAASDGLTIATISGQQTDAVAGSWTSTVPVAGIAPAGATRATLEMTSSFTGALALLKDGQLEERGADLRSAQVASAPVVGPIHTSVTGSSTQTAIRWRCTVSCSTASSPTPPRRSSPNRL